MKTRYDTITERMQQLQANSPDIEAIAVVSADGLTISAILPDTMEEDRVAAMSAAMLSLGERIAIEMQRGGLEQVYVRGLSGYILLSAIGDVAVLTVLAKNNARLGLLLLEMRRAAQDLLTLV